jgi:hypothetical protein
VKEPVDAGRLVMSTTTQVRRTGPGRGGERPAGSSEGPPAVQAAPVAAAVTTPRYRVMFVVPFQTAMSDADIHRLNSVLGMDTHLHPKLRASPASPGVSRLDFLSGLFLVRGDGPQDWRLEGRTWGAPAPPSIHGWHLVAADAARLLDPTVPVPSRLETTGLRTTIGGRTARRSRRRSRRWRRP